MTHKKPHPYPKRVQYSQVQVWVCQNLPRGNPCHTLVRSNIMIYNPSLSILKRKMICPNSYFCDKPKLSTSEFLVLFFLLTAHCFQDILNPDKFWHEELVNANNDCLFRCQFKTSWLESWPFRSGVIVSKMCHWKSISFYSESCRDHGQSLCHSARSLGKFQVRGKAQGRGKTISCKACHRLTVTEIVWIQTYCFSFRDAKWRIINHYIGPNIGFMWELWDPWLPFVPAAQLQVLSLRWHCICLVLIR